MAEDPTPGSGTDGGQPEGQPGGEESPPAGNGEEEEQPERADPFAGATSDPLADAVGGSASQSLGQAYRSWANMPGLSTLIAGSTFGDVHIGRATIYAGARRAGAPGAVRPEIIEKLVLRYVPVHGYGALLDQLQRTCLLALRGAPGTGRVTTGLRLLADAASGQVSRFSPDTDINQLPDEDLQKGCGYLIELIPGWAKSPAAATNADHLQHRLADRGCHMVVVLPHDIQYRAAFEDYITDCPVPDPAQLLAEAIQAEIHQRPDLAEPLRGLTGALGDYGGSRLPSGAWHAAAVMAACAAGEITAEEMTSRAGGALAQHVAGGFDPLAHIPASAAADEQVRLATFRIALAVFHQMPFDVVAEAGELLAAKIMTAGSPKRQPGRAVFASHRDDYLADSLARLAPGSIEFGKSSVSSAFAEYTDEWLPAAVLRHVWDVHNIRSQLLPWLQQLSRDPRPFVWMRAALSIGQLCSWDFSYTFHEIIDPWATRTDEDPRRHLVAAVALDAASRNPAVMPAVREIVSGWCRNGSPDQQWTAAAALGYDLGVTDTQSSIKNLQTVGSAGDPDLALIASWAIERIFAHGAVEPVLQAVDRWLGDDRREVRFLGLRAALRIANLTVADLDDSGAGAGTGAGRQRWRGLAQRENWPLLPALAEEDPCLLEAFADLVWPVTRSAAFQSLSLEALESWIRATQKDQACLNPVARLLRLLADTPSDQARLADLIEALRRDREDPLPDATATVNAVGPDDDPARERRRDDATPA